MEKYNNHFIKLNRQNNRNDPAWTKERTYMEKKKKNRAPGTALYTRDWVYTKDIKFVS